jgi:hypothetical protein
MISKNEIECILDGFELLIYVGLLIGFHLFEFWAYFVWRKLSSKMENFARLFNITKNKSYKAAFATRYQQEKREIIKINGFQLLFIFKIEKF